MRELMSMDPEGPSAHPPLPSLRVLLRQALASARRHPMATFLGLPSVPVLAAVGCWLPWFNFPFVLLALAPLLGGWPTIALAVARDQTMKPWAPFLGFRRYERFLALFGGPYLIACLAAMPVFVALWVDRHVLYGEGGWILFGGSGALSLGILFAVLHPFVLAPFVAADLEPREPFPRLLERSRELVEGRRTAVWGRVGELLLVATSGLLLGGVGVALTLPLAAVASAHLYLAAIEMRSKE